MDDRVRQTLTLAVDLNKVVNIEKSRKINLADVLKTKKSNGKGFKVKFVQNL